MVDERLLFGVDVDGGSAVVVGGGGYGQAAVVGSLTGVGVVEREGGLFALLGLAHVPEEVETAGQEDADEDEGEERD